MSAPVPPLPLGDVDHVLAQTRELWQEARGQSFFITGGTGFFGMWLLETFVHANDALSLGMRAVVLAQDSIKFQRYAPHLAARADLEFLEGDVRDFAFPAGEFRFVLHCATSASARLNDESPLEMFDVATIGTRRVLDFAVSAGTKKFLLTSSGAVYGVQPPECTHIPEDYTGAVNPLLPGSAYGEGKRVAEHLCGIYAHRSGCEVKIARCFAFIGPHLPLDAHFAIGNFVRDAIRGGPIQVSGDGTPLRSYLYAADLAVWLWTILFRGQSAHAYNVGSAHAYSITQVAAAVGAACGPGMKVSVAISTSLGKTPHRYVPDVNRVERELGLREMVPFKESIRRTLNWHFEIIGRNALAKIREPSLGNTV